MKKVLSIMLCIMLAISCLSVTALTASADTTPRYIVLLLDTSASMENGTRLADEKAAAIKFCETVTSSNSNSMIAIVTFSTDVTTICDFTNDAETLTSAISAIETDYSTNFIDALRRADELLTAESEKGINLERNIVLCSDGVPEHGDVSYDGPYTKDDAPSWAYPQANAALAYDKTLWDNTNVYTIGFFQGLSGKNATFAPRFMADLANKKSVVTDNVDDLIDTFEDFAEEIVKVETPDEPATKDEPTSSTTSTNSTSSKTNQNPSNAADIARAIETSDSVGFYGILVLSIVAFGAMAFVSKRNESAEK